MIPNGQILCPTCSEPLVNGYCLQCGKSPLLVVSRRGLFKAGAATALVLAVAPRQIIAAPRFEAGLALQFGQAGPSSGVWIANYCRLKKTVYVGHSPWPDYEEREVTCDIVKDETPHTPEHMAAVRRELDREKNARALARIRYDRSAYARQAQRASDQKWRDLKRQER